jgi:hypothetical protein
VHLTTFSFAAVEWSKCSNILQYYVKWLDDDDDDDDDLSSLSILRLWKEAVWKCR